MQLLKSTLPEQEQQQQQFSSKQQQKDQSTPLNKDTTSFLRSITLKPPASQTLHRNTSKLNKAAAATLNILSSNSSKLIKSESGSENQDNLKNISLYNNLNNNNNNNGHSNGVSNNFSNGFTTTIHGANNMNGLDSLNIDNNNSNNNNNHNKFTPCDDFVADFSSANIFDSNSSTATNAKQFGIIHDNSVNNNFSKLTNGMGMGTLTSIQNGITKQNAIADFADFDHNPIFIASGKLQYCFEHFLFCKRICLGLIVFIIGT